jgi:hypothetical protein
VKTENGTHGHPVIYHELKTRRVFFFFDEENTRTYSGKKRKRKEKEGGAKSETNIVICGAILNKQTTITNEENVCEG